MIETENFKFIPFDLENNLHKALEEELTTNSHSPFVKQVKERIHASKTNIIFGNSFVVMCDNLPIGYAYISAKPKDYIFFELLLSKNTRGKHYGRNILAEIEDYLFTNNPDLREIRLDIDNSNLASQKSAEANGYYSDEEDLDYLTNPTSLVYKKFNPYYKKGSKK